MPQKKQSYYDVLTEAINDIMEHGYDSVDRVAFWTEKLKRAAEDFATSTKRMEEILRDSLTDAYRKLVDRGELVDKYHFGVSRFTLERVRPELRAELDRRILASANLIRLNRDEAIQKTLQRFQGWSTSVPKGGTEAGKRTKLKANIRKSLTALPFEERRVLIDQGHKLVASLNDVMAKGGGAIAARWRSNFRQPNYNYRPDHKDRDGKVYLIRPSWALTQGFVKPSVGYYDQITAAAEEPFCRCYIIYIYTLKGMPKDMLTKKGEEAMAEAAARVREMA